MIADRMDNRRKHSRYAVAIGAEIDAGGAAFEGETRDLSEGGVSVLLPEQAATEPGLAEGKSVTLTLILTQDGVEDPEETPFARQASVMWSAPTDDGRFQLGLRFTALSADARGRLQRFLSKLG